MKISPERAKYYDITFTGPDDIPFYRGLLRSSESSVLELGCGTGRVILGLEEFCGYMHGIDISDGMLSICREKLGEGDVSSGKVRVEAADMSDFDLGRKFDLVIGPFHVFQNLETDEEVDGLFRCVSKHLRPSGSCVLNVFNPRRDAESMRRGWVTDDEKLVCEAPIASGRVTCHCRERRMDKERMIVYPELIYRKYDGDVVVDEVALEIPMRCYYPDEFEKLIVDHGFKVMNRWGGYDDEAYGDGPELIAQFAKQ